MKRILRISLRIFFILFTLSIFVYVAILSLFNKELQRDIHEAIPPLAYIGSFLGTFDMSYKYDNEYQKKKRLGDKLEKFLSWKKENKKLNIEGNRLILDDPRSRIELYSPVWTFRGKVSKDIEKLSIYYINKGRSIEKKYDILLGKKEGENLDIGRDIEMSLGKENLFNGTNRYVIEAEFSNGESLQEAIVLHIDYERIEIGDDVLYLNAKYIPEGKTEDILREAENLDNNFVSFVSYGCDPEQGASGVLVRQNYQYRTLPACLTFSSQEKYLLWFDFMYTQGGSGFFNIVHREKGILYKNYPLLENGLNTLYYNFVFFDEEENLLKFLMAKGDELQYGIEIQYYDISRKQNIIALSYANGTQLVVENNKEKMFVYLYKDWSEYNSLIHPDLRYIFSHKGVNERHGSLYTLPYTLLGPAKELIPTFNFKINLEGYFLIIDDGIKTIRLDTRLMGKTIENKPSPIVLNQRNVCKKIYADVYISMSGSKAENALLDEDSSVWFVGEGALSSGLEIKHKGKTYIPDQFAYGNFHLQLSLGKGNVENGNNIYTVIAYDEKGKKVCSWEKEIFINYDI